MAICKPCSLTLFMRMLCAALILGPTVSHAAVAPRPRNLWDDSPLMSCILPETGCTSPAKMCEAVAGPGDPTGAVTHCQCVKPDAPPKTSSVSLDSFTADLHDHACGNFSGYTWGHGILAERVDILYQHGEQCKNDPTDASVCLSGIATIIYNRSLGDTCKDPEGGLQFSKEECKQWMETANDGGW